MGIYSTSPSVGNISPPGSILNILVPVKTALLFFVFFSYYYWSCLYAILYTPNRMLLLCVLSLTI